MKGCLKPDYNNSRCTHPRKCVAFCAEGSEEVHVADEWDRSPAPARRLSYQDILELREIQRSLPRAEQIPDPLSNAPPPRYLSDVPLALLPLLPDAPSIPLPSPASSPSTSPPPGLVFSNFQHRSAPICPPQAPVYHPPSLAHLPTATPKPRLPKPTFHFLPLLNTPPATPSSSLPPSASNSPPIHAIDDNGIIDAKSASDGPISPISLTTQLPPGYTVPPGRDTIPPETPPPREEYIIINTVRIPIRELYEPRPPPSPPSLSFRSSHTTIDCVSAQMTHQSQSMWKSDRDKTSDSSIREVKPVKPYAHSTPLSPPPSPIRKTVSQAIYA